MVQDGARGRIRFNADDRFCLDGQRLVAISGVYGEDGTEYRTEIETFSHIVSHGLAPDGGPLWWEVRTKSGQHVRYGFNTDSRIEPKDTTKILQWAVDQIVDTVGNYLSVSYTEEDGSYRPSQVQYGGYLDGSGTVTSPHYASVDFLYEARPQVTTVFIGGQTIRLSKRLLSVESTVGSATPVLVSKYNLAYDTRPKTLDSQLISIEQCDSGTSCFAPLTFDWDYGTDGTVSYANPGVFGKGNGFTDGDKYPLVTGDWNGDGRMDIARVTSTGVKFMVSDGPNASNGFTDSWTHFNTLNDFSPAAGQGYSSNDTYPLVTGDWNGDGRTDIGRVGTNNVRFYVSEGNAWVTYPAIGDAMTVSHGFTNQTAFPITTGDWNGDGRTDLGRVNSTGMVFRISTGTGWTTYPALAVFGNNGGIDNGSVYPLLTGDWNGDGLTDLGRVLGTSINFRISNGNGWSSYESISGIWTPGQNYTDDSTYPFLIGDWNGDGLTDIGRVNFTGVAFRRSTGTGWTTYTGISGKYSPGQGYTDANIYPLFFGDWNGDGRSDFARISDWGVSIQVSTGLGWTSSGIGIPDIWRPVDGFENAHKYPVVSGDWNGDGLTDLARTGLNTGMGMRAMTAAPQRITKITDSLGRETLVDYAPLPQSEAYDPEPDPPEVPCALPCVRVTAPLYVVEAVHVDDGTAPDAGPLTYRTTEYAYTEGTADVDGRGFLGFRTMTATDAQTGIVTETTYEQSFPLHRPSPQKPHLPSRHQRR